MAAGADGSATHSAMSATRTADRLASKTDKDDETPEMLRTFSENLLGSVAGMHLFRQYLQGKCGARVYACWMHVQMFYQTRDPQRRWQILTDIKRLYMNDYAVRRLKKGLAQELLVSELLSFDMVPADTTTKKSKLYVGAGEVDLNSKSALRRVHAVLLDALRSYWVPCYVLHVLNTESREIVQALFKTSPEDEVDGSSLQKLIRRCTLFSKSAGSFGSSALRESIYLPRISVPSEESSSSLDMPQRILTEKQSSLTPLPKLPVVLPDLGLTSCSSSMSSIDDVMTEDTAVVDQQDMIFPDSNTDSPAPSVDTPTPEVRDESLGCNNNSSSQTKTDAKTEEDGDKDVDQSKSAMDVDDDGVWGVLHRTVVGTATNQVLYEIMSKTQDMSHMTYLLLHYVFGCRDLRRDDPKTDRLAHLRGLQSLLTPRYVLSTDNTHELELEKQLLLQHMAGDFLPNVEGLLLSPELKERLMDDLKHKGQSSLIFATQDILSNVLSIAATQFAVHDVITFRGATSITSLPGKKAEDGEPTLTIKQTVIPPNPWAEYPVSKIQGDAEKVRVEFSKFKGSTIVGVLTEQHRLLAFQYLILVSEECVACAEPAVCQTDLRTTSLCTVEDLTMMNWSNYGSLHIPYRTPEDAQPEEPEISLDEYEDNPFQNISDIDELLEGLPDIFQQRDLMDLQHPQQPKYMSRVSLYARWRYV
ncbi:hypothetical protein BaRGS_00006882 [Batillaria attramentaria]|uniref:Uncharacterized protein n=1 Tax=Batillaria attramentaria TaxID=370345 RepID=A0ABD0LRJ6_9CAEN